MAYLEIIEGSDAGMTFSIRNVVVLGRGTESDICLADARASREHARISQNKTRFVLEDLYSSNGTLLRNIKIFPGTIYDLTNGDQIRIGSTLLTFIDTDAKVPPSDAPTPSTDAFDHDYFEPLSPALAESLVHKAIAAPSHAVVPRAHKREPLPWRIRYDENSQHSVAVSFDASTNMAEVQREEVQTEHLHEVLKRLQTMCQVSTALGTIRDQSKLMQKILDCLLEIFPAAHRSFILLRESHSQKLIPVGVKQRHGEHNQQEELAISQSIVQEVLTNKRSILSVDAMDDDRFSQKDSIIDLAIRSMMCTPLLIEGELLGLIQVETNSNQQQFMPEDLQVLTGLSSQVAIAVKNAQLNEEIEAETAKRTSIQRYFSPKFVDMLMSGDVTTALGGDTYRGTILFADIIGFTTMSEAMSPADVLAKLNRYLTIIQKLIYENDGNIDKVSGDGIMAFWGVPHSDASDEANAVFTALQMQRHLWSFNLDLQAENQAPIHMGIGLNTGDFVAGNIGSEDKIEFTLIGDHVNLASRIEHLSGRNQVLISEATWQPIKHLVSAVRLPPLMVKGKSIPIIVYSIRGMESHHPKGYLMALPCHILDQDGQHLGRGILTDSTPLHNGLCLRLSTHVELACEAMLTLQVETVEYHRPLVCVVKVHSTLTGAHGGGSNYTKAVLTLMQEHNEDMIEFLQPGSCVATNYTWNDLKRR
jgi:adenylate cyclase